MERMWEDGRPPIYALVQQAIAARGEIAEEIHVDLEPAEARSGTKLRFVAGAFDALLGARDTSERQVSARLIAAAVSKALRRPSAETHRALYRKLTEVQTISIVDETLTRISPELKTYRARLADLALMIVRGAPDIEPVKMAVALLGISGDAEHVPLIHEIGLYEEITAFSVVALSHLLDEPEPAIFRLAREVHGWGRIWAVEHLAPTADPQIKDWILREGYRNTIMHEYLAYISATKGELLRKLKAPEIDDDLLRASGEILSALIRGGPAEEIADYTEGCEACVAFMRHAANCEAPNLRLINTVVNIRELGDSKRAEKLKAQSGWPAQSFMDIRNAAAIFLRKPEALAAVEAGLASEVEWPDFIQAAKVAPEFGIDPWPIRLARQKERVFDQWFFLMQTDDADRLEEVLSLAREQLDLAAIGSGPTEAIGFGAEFGQDRALDFILQDLDRFPRRGWDLIKVGLRARGVRTRSMAMRALNGWERGAWPAEAEKELSAALLAEPDPSTRQRLSDLLAGQLDD